jgi:signal transduction histidine kinase
MVSVYFNKVVVHNLHHLTSIFRRHFSGPEERSIIERLGSHDEISGLVGGMEELAGHLNRARNELEKYASNLEEMVVERTLELQQEALRHRSDVNLFVHLLQGLNQSESRPDMVAHAVGQIGRRFAAERVIYYCTVVSHQVVVWPPDDSREKIPSFWQELMTENSVRFEACAAYVPVKSQDCAWGLLGIHWPEGKKPEKITEEVLLALGQQLGIALENIHAINNLTHQKDMLQSVFEGISNPLMLLDGNGGILMANKWATVLTEQGASKSQLRGALKKVLGTEASSPQGSIIGRALKDCIPWEQSVQLPDGRSFWTSIYPIAVYSPEPDCVVLYARENTKEKRMLARLQLAEKLSAVGQLAAGLAHEINNPLSVIQCYTDILMADAADDQTRSDLKIISRHTGQAREIVQNLLNFARPKASVTATCSINTVITSIADVFRLQAAGKSARLLLELAGDLPEVRGDAASLEQILTNLWLNAFDAVPAGSGRIRIKTAFVERSAEVLLQVSDNGPGIAEENLENIFDPFFTTKDVGQGSGLGLAVVYGLAGELGARIEVENRSGAVFNLYLSTT